MQRFRVVITLYIASLLVISVVTAHRSTSWSSGYKSALEASRESLVHWIMENGGKSASTEQRDPIQSEKGKKDRKNKKGDNLMTTTSTPQPRRRSGRLANRNWKDLSGISSKSNPIILDSDSNDEETEEESGVEAGYCDGLAREGLQGCFKGAEVIGRRKIN